ncbi:met-10+ like-protein [Cystoisospora suis]|uniref:tRNA (guanine(37)-N1)-methyltransferase n=1 Tax=Cystoisospora suis TaxID=483139 RepID=A0A2C6LB86_9APIC|nr:met-10+ like-protein [Cystoisospora suis]
MVSERCRRGMIISLLTLTQYLPRLQFRVQMRCLRSQQWPHLTTTTRAYPSRPSHRRPRDFDVFSCRRELEKVCVKDISFLAAWVSFFRHGCRRELEKVCAKDISFLAAWVSSFRHGCLRQKEILNDLLGLPTDLRTWLRSQPTASIGRQRVHLAYCHMTAEEALRRIVPEGLEMPRRFETVGHIAHLNLREELLPYRFLIARILLDKQPALRTVINKTGIASQWRELQFEHLGGERLYVARLKENDMYFEVDYERVYWNSRLAAEREKITAELPSTSIVLDMFSGVGAFALFLAKRGCLVLANDGNPRAVDCMRKNMKLNKITQDNLLPFNLDARDFVRQQAGSPRHIVNLVKLREQLSLREADGSGCWKEKATRKRKRHKQSTSNGQDSTACAGTEEACGACPVVSRVGQPDETSVEEQSRVIRNAWLPNSGGDSSLARDSTRRVEPDGASVTKVGEAPTMPLVEIHYLMNLPELAIEFLDVFPGLLASEASPPDLYPRESTESETSAVGASEGQSDSGTGSENSLTRVRHWVHCYGFSRTVPPIDDFKPRVQKSLGWWPTAVSIREVRDVAPNKRMYCLSFEIPSWLLVGGKTAFPASSSPAEEARPE